MSRPVVRPTPTVEQQDHHRRIRILESIPNLGQGIELQGVTDVLSGTVDWSSATTLNDPHEFYDAGSPTILTIPDGLAGIYVVSICFEITAE